MFKDVPHDTPDSSAEPWVAVQQMHLAALREEMSDNGVEVEVSLASAFCRGNLQNLHKSLFVANHRVIRDVRTPH